ncbi:MAG: T9SS type A sorting domain-containing protein [Flavobacteriales bacterium]|nr:T9SS type A sorting domain-containing protein [Flavobacteriales bacterium]
MKKLLLIPTICAVLGVQINAQSLEIEGGTNLVEGSVSVPEDSELDAHWDVVNASSNELTVRAKRTIITNVAGSKERFCWGPLCYNYGTAESSTNVNLMVTMAPGATESTFHGYYEHEGNAGMAVIEYCFFDNNNPSDETCQTVTFCVDAECAVGISETEIDGSLGEMSPNPVKGMASLTYSLTGPAQGSKIVIYNLVGKEVKQISLENRNGIVFLNAQDFENGVYFYALQSNGKVLGTKRFIVTKE